MSRACSLSMHTLATVQTAQLLIYICEPPSRTQRFPHPQRTRFTRLQMDCYGAYCHKPVCQWVMCHGSHIPHNAVPGGEDRGEAIFIGRAVHDNDVIPGKVLPSHGCCYVSYAGAEHSHRDYQVLISDGPPMAWIPASNGSVPTGAIQGGKSCTGEPLYIGRTFHDGTLTIGKVHPSHNCLYIPYGGEEHRYADYEVLVCKTINF